MTFNKQTKNNTWINTVINVLSLNSEDRKANKMTSFASLRTQWLMPANWGYPLQLSSSEKC